MSSINLLPEKFRLSSEKTRERKAILAVSAFLILASIVSYAAAYVYKMSITSRLSSLNSEIESIDRSIEAATSDNKLFLARDEVKDIAKLLSEHHYYSQVFEALQKMITKKVYLTNLSFGKGSDNGVLTLEVEGVAKDYLSAINQIAAFKNSYWVKEVKVESVSGGKGKEGIRFSGQLKLRKELALYQEPYWNFGLSLLSSKVNRYIRIDEYSAELKKEEKREFVDVKFGGIAYNDESLSSFESDLREMEKMVEDVSISYKGPEKESSTAEGEVIKFKGEMKLKWRS